MKFKIIIGLGNSEKEYAKTYHNMGHVFVDYWNEQKGKEKGFRAYKTDGFMNQVGDSVRKILKEKNLKIQEALIVHDDSDIYLGDYKISSDRGAAGHKGVEHIIAVFGTQNFIRLRIGIRPRQKAGAERQKAEKFVLKNISTTNMKVLKRVFEEAIELFNDCRNLK